MPVLFDVNTLSGTALLAFVLVGILALGLLKTIGSVGAGSGAEPVASSAPDPRPVSPTELARATGLDGNPIYIAVKSPVGDEVTVFDMTKGGRDFYGPGGPYHVFAGRDASCGLGKMSVEEEDLGGDLSSLSADEFDSMAQWYQKFAIKYVRVGWLEAAGAAADREESQVTSETKKDQ